MKTDKSYLWIYFFSLAAGILLLLFAGSANLLSTIVIILGILLLLPSAGSLIVSLFPKKDETGVRHYKWYYMLSSLCGILFGVLLVAMPAFFAGYIIYTFGVILLLCGIVQIIMLARGGRQTIAWFYITPLLTLIGGVVIIIIGPGGVTKIINIVNGIILLCYSLNGLFGYLLIPKRNVAEISETSTSSGDEEDVN